MGDVALNLTPKHRARPRSSHEIALDLRERIAAIPLPEGASLKVVEPPPGPPVMATLLAEIYGPDAETRRAVAARVEEAFRSVPSSSISTIPGASRRPRPGDDLHR
jgi:hypothetical protein